MVIIIIHPSIELQVEYDHFGDREVVVGMKRRRDNWDVVSLPPCQLILALLQDIKPQATATHQQTTIESKFPCLY